MPKYIKSYSNYVVKKRHQSIKDGEIFERDITTIDGLNQFAPGQVPIYRDGTFIITVNNEAPSSRDVSSGAWEENDFGGEIWTIDSISGLSDDNETDEEGIRLNTDPMSLRDFAYFGSCSELIRTSITDVLLRFPGELYGDDTKTITYTYTEIPNYYDRACPLGAYLLPKESDDEYITDIVNYYTVAGALSCGVTGDPTVYLMENPFAIDMKLANLNPKDIMGSELKFFANEGYKSYIMFSGDEAPDTDNESAYTITDWAVSSYTDGIDYELITPAQASYLNSHTIENQNECVVGSVFKNGVWQSGDTRIYLVSGKTSHITSSVTIGEVAYTIVTAKTDHYAITIEPSGSLTQRCLCYTESSGPYSGKTSEYNPSKVSWGTCPPTGTTAALHRKPCLPYGNCPGDECCTVEIKSQNGAKLTLHGFLGDDMATYFVVNKSAIAQKWHVRPLSKYFDKFLREGTAFERVLMNPETDPRYKATFSIVHEDEFGYYSTLETFIMPTGRGGYNIGADSVRFNDYINRLSEIATFYDERFSDNIWRSMTHEAVKNFDWTYTREFDPQSDGYMEGGSKVAKYLRLAGMEFDEIKRYIDAIPTNNRVTYDGRNNIPDYFMSDMVEQNGFEPFAVYPKDMTEYTEDENGVKTIVSADPSDREVNKKGNDHLWRTFSDDTSGITVPYALNSNNADNPDGYFMVCQNCEMVQQASIPNPKGDTQTASERVSAYDFENDKTIFRHKLYGSNEEWTMQEGNTEFLRRLFLNAKQILRHKGTQEGIEMILGMFGLRSKRWVEEKAKLASKSTGHKPYEDVGDYDFDMREYTHFAERKLEGWHAQSDMYYYDFLNKCKTITYNTPDARFGVYYSYQGLPVTYRDSADEYLSYSSTTNPSPTDVKVTATSGITDVSGDAVFARYLYPYFDKNTIYDGNPYYQMKGGWRIRSPFKFDNDNNIITNKVCDDMSLETLRTLKNVRDIEQLMSVPRQTLHNGSIYHVEDLFGDFAIIDGHVYPLNVDGAGYKYFSVYVANGTVQIGNVLFDNKVTVSDPYQCETSNPKETTYDLSNKPMGYEIRVYVIESGSSYEIKAYDDSEGGATIATYSLFYDGCIDGNCGTGDSATTEYFILGDADYSDEMSEYGWRQLRKNDPEYYKINAIKDMYKGNNPHAGNLVYDDGYEYFTYFNQLFKYAIEQDAFDTRCFGNDLQVYDDIYAFGFANLIDSGGCQGDFVRPDGTTFYYEEDSKIHYFGHYLENKYGGKTIYEALSGVPKNMGCEPAEVTTSRRAWINTTKQLFYSASDKLYIYECFKNEEKGYKDLFSGTSYTLSAMSQSDNGVYMVPTDRKSGVLYGHAVSDKDGMTCQIVNCKRYELDIRLMATSEYSEEYLKEVKYFEDVILPYMEQMLPSSIIYHVNYKTR